MIQAVVKNKVDLHTSIWSKQMRVNVYETFMQKEAAVFLCVFCAVDWHEPVVAASEITAPLLVLHAFLRCQIHTAARYHNTPNIRSLLIRLAGHISVVNESGLCNQSIYIYPERWAIELPPSCFLQSSGCGAEISFRIDESSHMKIHFGVWVEGYCGLASCPPPEPCLYRRAE